MSGYDYKDLDEIFHSRIRLAITSILVAQGEVDFVTLKHLVQATDGNMNTHLKKLEQSDYITVTKTFEDRKPVTYYKLTQRGIESFKEYVSRLERFIHQR